MSTTRHGSIGGLRSAHPPYAYGDDGEGTAMQTAKNKNGVGASLLRKEDDRHLRGRGEFVADIRLPGTQEVVFLR